MHRRLAVEEATEQRDRNIWSGRRDPLPAADVSNSSNWESFLGDIPRTLKAVQFPGAAKERLATQAWLQLFKAVRNQFMD
jgi:hypothetical protein